MLREVFERRALGMMGTAVCVATAMFAVTACGGGEPTAAGDGSDSATDGVTDDGAVDGTPGDGTAVDDPAVDEPTVEDPLGDPLDDPGGTADEPCVSTERFFAQEAWGRVFSKKCVTCHNSQGAAKDTHLILQSSALSGFMETNFETVKLVAGFEYQGEPMLLLKPLGELNHGGGAILTEGDDLHGILAELVRQFGDPIECAEEDAAAGAFFDGVTRLGPVETFRRAALITAGRVPTDAEAAYLVAAGEAGLDAMLDELSREPAFVDWVIETWNDRMLTDRYLPGNQATNLLNNSDYPARKWYDDEAFEAGAGFKQMGKSHANRAVARQALELIAHIVENDEPFTEVVTADYTVVNPYSAVSFGVADEIAFEDPLDPDEFQPVALPGIPHAGVLTSQMVLNRFPTTDTNRNRHRSRVVYDLFLATDVMKLAERPIDPTSIEDHNPTMFNPDCTACHATIDPVAGAFQNWDGGGRYLPPEEGWHADMRPPGFGDLTVPYDERTEALQWLGQAIADDERFVTSVIRTTWYGLNGRYPLPAPSEDEEGTDETYAARALAYEAQRALFDAAGEMFVDSGYNYRTLVAALIDTPWFRASGLDHAPDGDEAVEFAELGTARFLTPERLHAKIEAVTGFPWRNGPTGVDYLLDVNQFRIFYGGIDSNLVNQRITSPNGLMARVGERMANEMACLATARDLSLPKSQRHLLPYVEASYLPWDANGFEVTQALAAIRENIRLLHWHVLGERLPAGHAELETTWELFVDVMDTGRAAVAAGEEPTALPNSCRSQNDWWTGAALAEEDVIVQDPNYTVRAWMAVVAYLLSDYRFLHE